VLKVYKEHNKTQTWHEPKGRRPTNQANQGLVIWRKRPRTQTKPSPNGAKLCRRGPYIPRDPLDKDWVGTALPGCGRTLVHPHPYGHVSGPSFTGYILPSYLHRLSRFGPGSMHLGGRFGHFMRGSKAYSMKHPLLSTYKWRPPPPH
jgi:hypothetical protein